MKCGIEYQSERINDEGDGENECAQMMMVHTPEMYDLQNVELKFVSSSIR